ncbi:MAG: methyltransferase domain-containing protein [Pseudomonadota bacterium]
MTPDNQTQIFDRTLNRARKVKAYQNFSDFDFLHQFASNQLKDRLSDITRNFETIIQLGGYHEQIIEGTHTVGMTDKHAVIADEEFLPFGKNSLDLVLSPLCLHTANDLPGALIQINHALKPDGLFLGAMFGGETLFELRESLNKAEIELSGGLSPRIFPFADKQQMGGLMQRAGFALPVVDSDLITVTYPNLQKLFADLRGVGEGNIIRDRRKGLTHPALFQKAEDYYRDTYTDSGGKLEATFEIIFLTGWSPHDSQQKPLRPGSAEHSLAEKLGTQEVKTGEKVGP